MKKYGRSPSGHAIESNSVHSIKPSSSGPTYWTQHRLARAKKTLTRRTAMLRTDLARELRKHSGLDISRVIANVADADPRSLAESIEGLRSEQVNRYVAELLDLERALLRLANGTYGYCVGCGQAIEAMTLEFRPQAANCLHCHEAAAERPHERSLRDETARV